MEGRTRANPKKQGKNKIQKVDNNGGPDQS